MRLDKYTTASRTVTEYEIDRMIFAKHDTVPIVLTIPHDSLLGIKDDSAVPEFSFIRKGDAAVSFAAGDKVVLVGTVPTAVKDGNPVSVVRNGVDGANVVWSYKSAGAGTGGGAWGEITGTLENQTDLATVLDAKADAFDSEPIVANTLLTAAAHANRDLLVNNGASDVTLTLQLDADSGCNSNESFNAFQFGTGFVTIVAAVGVTLRAPNGTTATTLGQYQWVGAVRVGPDEYVLTEKVASSVSSSQTSFAASGYMAPDRANNASVSTGGAIISGTGTLTARAIGAGNLVTKTLRFGYVGTAAANTEVGVGGSTDTTYFDGRAVILRMVFAVSDAIASDAKQQHGYMSSTNGLGNTQEPDGSYGSRACLGARSTDTNFVFITNDASGAPTVTTINGGTGFPCNDPTKLYEFTSAFFLSGPRRVEMELKNLSDNITSGVNTFTSNIPDPADLLKLICKRSSGANVASPALDFNWVGFGKFA